MSQVVRDFLAYCESEAPELGHKLDRFGDDPALEDLLARFDIDKKRTLSWRQSQLARAVLEKLQSPSPKSLQLLSQVLSLLGLRAVDGADADVALATEMLDLFCKADSVNDTLSSLELRMLLSALTKLDADGDGVLGAEERAGLRDRLLDPDELLDELLRD